MSLADAADAAFPPRRAEARRAGGARGWPLSAAHAWYRLRNHFFDLMIYRDAMRWWADGHPLYDYAQPDATQGQLEFTYPAVRRVPAARRWPG